jgi:hypothetical protein
MMTVTQRTLVGLALSLVLLWSTSPTTWARQYSPGGPGAAGGQATALTIPAAPAAPTLAVVGQVGASYLTLSGDQIIYLYHLTLHITGSGFIPGSTVRIAVLNPSSWAVIGKGRAYAQGSVITTWCDDQHTVCTRANPEAGIIDYRMRLNSVPGASTLLMLYRSGHYTGMRDVTF